MTDLHDNVFYYYRGSRHPKYDGYDQQLEDNTTKALINTLQHCSPTIVRQFLAWLGVETTSNVRVELQKPTIGNEKIRSARQRVLLGIVAVENPEIGGTTDVSGDGDGRPDAWLYGEDFVVVVESKVGNAQLRRAQMTNHLRKLQAGTSRQPKRVVKRWAEVHQFFWRLPEASDKDKWIVGQFTQYLERTGMTEFTGFEEWMFQFFAREERDEEEKKLIRRTMERFGDKVMHGGLRATNPAFYQASHVGNVLVGADHAWVAFGPAGGPKVFGRKAHQTVSLYDYGLDVFMNVELAPAAKLLKARIRREGSRFAEIVSDLPGRFSAVVEERRMRAGEPMKSDYYLLATLEGGARRPSDPGAYGLKAPASSAFDYLVKLLDEIPLPYFSIRGRIERKLVLELSRGGGDALIEKVLSVMNGFQPLLEFING